MRAKTKKAPKKITPKYLHNAGLAYLQKFAASTKGFETVLMRKVKRSCLHHKNQDFESCRVMVADIVRKFERAGLLNDKVFAEGMVSSLRRSGKSKKMIGLKLTHKGVSRTLARETLEDFDLKNHGDAAEFEAARAFCKKKRLAAKDPEKALSAFARAGFSYDIARKILKG